MPQGPSPRCATLTRGPRRPPGRPARCFWENNRRQEPSETETHFPKLGKAHRHSGRTELRVKGEQARRGSTRPCAAPPRAPKGDSPGCPCVSGRPEMPWVRGDGRGQWGGLVSQHHVPGTLTREGGFQEQEGHQHQGPGASTPRGPAPATLPASVMSPVWLVSQQELEAAKDKGHQDTTPHPVPCCTG